MDDARKIVASFYPELGETLPERSYADECTLYTPGHADGSFHNFMDKMDVFVPCHFFGWVVKVKNSCRCRPLQGLHGEVVGPHGPWQYGRLELVVITECVFIYESYDYFSS